MSLIATQRVVQQILDKATFNSRDADALTSAIGTVRSPEEAAAAAPLLAAIMANKVALEPDDKYTRLQLGSIAGAYTEPYSAGRLLSDAIGAAVYAPGVAAAWTLFPKEEGSLGPLLGRAIVGGAASLALAPLTLPQGILVGVANLLKNR
jgi:hypothetical protein